MIRASLITEVASLEIAEQGTTAKVDGQNHFVMSLAEFSG
jgi:hypothetical protein